MVYYKLVCKHYPSAPLPQMVTDSDGDWVTRKAAEELERENEVLRRELVKYKTFNEQSISDQCELETELEKLGVVFYDDYGH